jgi:hypothetical protein
MPRRKPPEPIRPRWVDAVVSPPEGPCRFQKPGESHPPVSKTVWTGGGSVFYLCEPDAKLAYNNTVAVGGEIYNGIITSDPILPTAKDFYDPHAAEREAIRLEQKRRDEEYDRLLKAARRE